MTEDDEETRHRRPTVTRTRTPRYLRGGCDLDSYCGLSQSSDIHCFQPRRTKPRAQMEPTIAARPTMTSPIAQKVLNVSGIRRIFSSLRKISVPINSTMTPNVTPPTAIPREGPN